jgi:hypothetical protein
MSERPPEIYGIPISELARICHVSLKTAGRWKAGTTCPPQSAMLLLSGDLGSLDPEWRGWRVRGGVLHSPEGWEISRNDVLATPLMRQQLAAYQSELRQIQERLDAMPEQPAPADWPEWIGEMRA